MTEARYDLDEKLYSIHCYGTFEITHVLPAMVYRNHDGSYSRELAEILKDS